MKNVISIGAIALITWLSYESLLSLFRVKHIHVFTTNSIKFNPETFKDKVTQLGRIRFLSSLESFCSHIKQDEWVQSCSAERVFPDQWYLDLTYHKPIIRLIRSGKIITQSGKLVQDSAGYVTGPLPIYEGDDDHSKVAYQLYLKANSNAKVLGVVEYVKFNESGWLIEFARGIQVKLGEKHLLKRLELFLNLWPKHFSLKSMKQTFDMRYHNGFAYRELKHDTE
ncbi:MAG: cell division protein FtsQ/DivIB [Pseudomonadota bacterium]|nr:cell division protein FtsQ/DivIB [Pseudomonadota bacterium]